MAHRSGNATWQDTPSTATLVSAARLEALETAVDNSPVPASPVPAVGSYLGAYAGTSNGPAQPPTSGGMTPCIIVVGTQITVDQIGVTVDTLESGIFVKALLYGSDANGLPGSLVINSGAFDCSTTGNKLNTVTATVLPAGTYWGAIIASGGTVVRLRYLAQSVVAGVSSTFNDLTAPPNPPLITVGTYASPASTATVSYTNSSSGNNKPFIGLHRSA